MKKFISILSAAIFLSSLALSPALAMDKTKEMQGDGMKQDAKMTKDDGMKQETGMHKKDGAMKDDGKKSGMNGTMKDDGMKKNSDMDKM